MVYNTFSNVTETSTEVAVGAAVSGSCSLWDQLSVNLSVPWSLIFMGLLLLCHGNFLFYLILLSIYMFLFFSGCCDFAVCELLSCFCC